MQPKAATDWAEVERLESLATEHGQRLMRAFTGSDATYLLYDHACDAQVAGTLMTLAEAREAIEEAIAGRQSA